MLTHSLGTGLEELTGTSDLGFIFAQALIPADAETALRIAHRSLDFDIRPDDPPVLSSKSHRREPIGTVSVLICIGVMPMLRLSKLTDYGTVAMVYIARDADRTHAAAELAATIGLAVPTVSKILKMLAGAKLLRSVRGAKGGYMLSRPAGEISIAELIDALEGPIGLTECSVVTGLCALEGSCSVRGNWQRINGVIRDALGQMTLADLAQPTFRPVRLGARQLPRPRALA